MVISEVTAGTRLPREQKHTYTLGLMRQEHSRMAQRMYKVPRREVEEGAGRGSCVLCKVSRGKERPSCASTDEGAGAEEQKIYQRDSLPPQRNKQSKLFLDKPQCRHGCPWAYGGCGGEQPLHGQVNSSTPGHMWSKSTSPIMLLRRHCFETSSRCST